MQEGGSSEEFLESVKVDLFPDKVYVFTPKGEILRLPRGATVVDFAYAVHTDVGNRCVAAKVDRRLTPLRTRAAQRPDRRDHHREGRDAESVVGELRRHGEGAQPPSATISRACAATEAIELGAAAASTRRSANSSCRWMKSRRTRSTPRVGELGMKDVDELYEKVGLGERLAPLVARRLLPAKPTRGRRLGRAARRSRSPAPKACWSPTRAAASRFPTTRSSRSCRPAAASSSTARTA